jgi:hypothetical protein
VTNPRIACVERVGVGVGVGVGDSEATLLTNGR